MPTGVLRVVPVNANHKPADGASPIRPTRHSVGSQVRLAVEPMQRPQVIRRSTARPAADVPLRARPERTSTAGSSATVAVGTTSPRDLEESLLLQPELPAVEEQPHPAAGPNLTLFAYEQKQQEDSELGAVSDLSHKSGLKEVPVEQALLTLKRHATFGKLTRSEFLEGYEE
eukprot:5980757-Amphidinium_carterae.3